jgi:hypothetical protein
MCNANGGPQKDTLEDFGWRKHIDILEKKMLNLNALAFSLDVDWCALCVGCGWNECSLTFHCISFEFSKKIILCMENQDMMHK